MTKEELLKAIDDFVANYCKAPDLIYLRKKFNASFAHYLPYLRCVQNNPFHSAQLVNVKDECPLVPEVRRAVIRLLNLLLIDESKREVFCISQTSQLTTLQFDSLSQRVRALQPLMRQALIIATLMSSMTLSPDMLRLMKGRKIKPIMDSVKFLHQVMHLCPDIVPMFELVDPKDRESVVNSVRVMLTDYAHLRHILFLEGGVNMFEKICQFTAKEFSLWRLYWEINIAGFVGGNPNALFGHALNRPIADKIQLLENSVTLKAKATSHSLCDTYLTSLIQYHELDEASNGQSLLALYLFSLCKIESEEEQQEVITLLSQQEFPPLARVIAQIRESQLRHSPTFFTLFMEKLLGEFKARGLPLDKALQHTFNLGGMISEAAISASSSDSLPICFKLVAKPEAISQLVSEELSSEDGLTDLTVQLDEHNNCLQPEATLAPTFVERAHHPVL